MNQDINNGAVRVLRDYTGRGPTQARSTIDRDSVTVVGELPAELDGMFIRNGPNPQFAPRGPYHWFAGDGMIHAFHIENGNIVGSVRGRLKGCSMYLGGAQGPTVLGTLLPEWNAHLLEPEQSKSLT